MRCAALSCLRHALALLAAVAAGCASSGPPVPADSVYAGAGFYDPWYWGPIYREPPIVLGPPRRAVYPIAPAARQTPATPARSTPR